MTQEQRKLSQEWLHRQRALSPVASLCGSPLGHHAEMIVLRLSHRRLVVSRARGTCAIGNRTVNTKTKGITNATFAMGLAICNVDVEHVSVCNATTTTNNIENALLCWTTKCCIFPDKFGLCIATWSIDLAFAMSHARIAKETPSCIAIQIIIINNC